MSPLEDEPHVPAPAGGAGTAGDGYRIPDQAARAPQVAARHLRALAGGEAEA